MDILALDDLDPMLDVAKRGALEAGRLIKGRMGRPSSVDSKEAFDYVTDVDRQAQGIILSMIKERFPDHAIMSEEAPRQEVSSRMEWIVDPLDGTTNFIHGFPMVAVSIALRCEKELVLGVVHDPIRGETFEAIRGKGAWLNGDPLSVREPPSLSRALVATGFPFREKGLVEPYLACFRKIFNTVSDVRRAGSAALDLAYVAAGRLSGFWELGLASWDVAAGGLLVHEAGGLVTDFWCRGDFVENGHIVAASSSLHPFLLEQVRRFLVPHLKDIPKNAGRH